MQKRFMGGGDVELSKGTQSMILGQEILDFPKLGIKYFLGQYDYMISM